MSNIITPVDLSRGAANKGDFRQLELQDGYEVEGPLNALFDQSARGKTDLCYPLDLLETIPGPNDTLDTKPFVKFMAQKFDGMKFGHKTTLEPNLRQIAAAADPGMQNAALVLTNANLGLGLTAALTTALVAYFTPTNPPTGPQDPSTSGTPSPPHLENLATIRLFLPHKINENYATDWTSPEVGFWGGAAASEDTWENVKDYFSTYGSDFDSMGLREMLGKALALPTGNQSMAAMLMRNAGGAVNPHLEMFFRGVQFRRFKFDFVFSPTSADEAEEVARIVRTFKYHAAPELLQNKAQYGRYFKYPSQFKIHYSNEDATHTLDTCVLNDVQVDYSAAPTNQLFRDVGKNGRHYPLQTSLMLSFTETTIQDKATIGRGR